MPSFYVHISVADHVAALLAELHAWPQNTPQNNGLFGAKDFPGPEPQRLAKIAKAYPNYYALGAIGPDLFFLLPDFRKVAGEKVGNHLVGVADFVNDLTEWVNEWVLSWWEPTFGLHSQNLEETISRLTGDLAREIGDAMGALASLTVRAALTLVSVTDDWLGYFSLGHNEGFDNRAFLWSDMLHYRKTSQFGQALWQLADTWEARADPNDPRAVAEGKLWADRLRAYALGYITHLATDTTGHPFTNEKSGGPFRTHWQRHKLVENHIDAQVYQTEHGKDAEWQDITASALHYRVAFSPSGGVVTPRRIPQTDAKIQNLYIRRRLLDVKSDLPLEVATLLYEALGTAYIANAIPNHPTESAPNILSGDGRPSPDAIQDTYKFMFRYLRHIMLDGYWHGKPLPPELFPNLEFPLQTDPADEAPSLADKELDFLDLLLSVVRVSLGVLAVVIWILTLPIGALLDIATFGPRNLIYYCIDLPVYNMTQALRQVLVMTGYLLPRQDEIAISLTQIGVGPRDLFLATLEAMEDTLANIDDRTLAALGARAEQAARQAERSPQDALTALIGELDLSRYNPQEPSDNTNYPRQHEPDEHHHPWRYPQSNVEQGKTTAGPFQHGDNAELLVGQAIQGDVKIRQKYEASQTPESTEKISQDEMSRSANLGDPIHFSAYLMWQLTRTENLDGETSRLTDWNLDADRGYAWKCWDWNRKDGETFQDKEGNKVRIPCTPPSQFKPIKDRVPNIEHDPADDLAVHWADQNDPGCKKEALQ